MSTTLSRVADTTSKFAALAATPLFPFENLADAPGRAGKGSTAPATPALYYPANSEIYAEGDEAKFFYKVTSGVVRTCKFLSDGTRQIDAFHVAGDVFGFACGDEHGLSAEAVSDCRVTRHRRRGLEHLLASDDAMAASVFSYAMRCLEHARSHAFLLGRGTAVQKLAAFLSEMSSLMPAGDMVDLAMTRQDIADYLALTIETVSRTLAQLERDGVIALSSARRIRLKNLSALRALNA
jgi:CRP/FNR family nitrogen fixation transcriptional regulator